jgi:autotransporter-associated beta strand protein
MKNLSIACVASFLRYPAGVALLLAALPAVQAADYYWNTTSNSTWITTTAWSNNSTSAGTTGTVPTSSDNATLNQSSVNGNEIVSLTAATSINGITFNNTGTTTIASSSTTNRALTIGAGGITLGATAGNVTFDTTNKASATIGANQTWTNNNAAATLSGFNAFTLNGNSLTLAGAGNFNIGASIASTAPAILNADQSGIILLGAGNGNINFLGTFNIGLNGGTVLLGPNLTHLNGAALVNIKGGTLASNSSGAKSLNSPNVSVTGNFTLGQAVTGTGAVTILGAMDLNGATREITVANAADTISGIITNGSLTKAGSGTLTLQGANTYTGSTTVNAGTLTFLNTNAKPASGTHAFSAGTTLGLGVATSGSFYTSADIDNAFAGTMTGNLNNVTVAATTNVGIDTTQGNFTYASSVGGSPTKGLVKLGNGTLTLSGTGANTYTGLTTVSAGGLTLAKTATVNAIAGNVLVNGAGTLTLGAADQIVDTSTVEVATGGTFAMSSSNETIAGLTLTGGAITGGNATAPVTLTVGSGTLDLQKGTVSANVILAGAVAANKSTSGNVVLYGNNTYTGNTTVTAGTLGLRGSSASPVSLTDGTVLQLDLASPVTSTSTLSFAGNATVRIIGTPVAATTYNLFTGSAIIGTPALSAPISGFTLSNTGTVLQLGPSDTTKPIITLIGNATLTVNIGTTYTDAGATATDETAPANPTVTTSGSVNTAVPGNYVLSYNAVDTVGNNALTVTRTVTVVDATAPGITLTGGAAISVDWGSPYSDAGATAADNYDTSVIVTTSGTVNTAKPGTYTLTYNATDVANNAATPVTRTVTVAIANATTAGADGYTPLMRYALGADSPSATIAAPVTSATATELSLTAVVRTDDPKLSVVGTTRTDLTSGTWTTTGVSGTPAGSGTEGDQTGVLTGQRRVYTVTTATRTFLRLEATLAP